MTNAPTHTSPLARSEAVQEFFDYMEGWSSNALMGYILSRYDDDAQFLSSTHDVYDTNLASSYIREIEGFATNDVLVKLVLDNKDDVVAFFNVNTEKSASHMMPVSGLNAVVATNDELAAIVNSEALEGNRQVMVALALYTVSEYSAEYCRWRRRLMDAAGDQAAYECAMEDFAEALDVNRRKMTDIYSIKKDDFDKPLELLTKRAILNSEANLNVNDLGVATDQNGAVIDYEFNTLNDIVAYITPL
jgi:hypothetical protein